MPGKTVAPVNTSGFWEFLFLMLLLFFVLSLASGASKNLPGGGLPQPTSTSIASETGPIFVKIVNPEANVEKAIAHVLETNETDDFDQKTLSLKICSKGQHISVWTPGYYIITFECGDNPAAHYDVQLEPFSSTNNLNYGWLNAGNCKVCHSKPSSNLIDESSEWEKDGHSQSLVSTYFSTTYMGTDVSGRPSQQIQWTILDDGQKIYPLLDPMKPDFGAGYRLDYPVSNGNCAFCHVPAGAPGTLQEMDLAGLIGLSHGGTLPTETEGVTCDICHKVTDVLVEKNSRLPYDDRPGVLSMSLLRPSSNQQFFGPLAYEAMMGNTSNSTCFPVFGESKFCAACHYAKFANTLIYGSYKEWLDSPYSNPADPNYRTCQDCHMRQETDPANPIPAHREACSDASRELQNYNHNMMKYETEEDFYPPQQIPTIVREAAQISLAPTLANGQIHVAVTVQNTGAGHKFPTDSPLRHLVLLITAEDWRGSPLTQSGGSTVPVWAAPDLAGYAGQVFANILKDKDTNLAPSFAYWNPVEPAWDGADTRLPPRVPVQSVYSFAAPYERSAKITAWLIYRKAFKNVADKKGWSSYGLDVEVTRAAVECTGFGPEPQNMVCNPVPTQLP